MTRLLYNAFYIAPSQELELPIDLVNAILRPTMLARRLVVSSLRALRARAPQLTVAVIRPTTLALDAYCTPPPRRVNTFLVAAASAAAAAAMAASAPVTARAEPAEPKAKILCLNGINLNMFGKRDPGTYGTATLADINAELEKLAGQLGEMPPTQKEGSSLRDLPCISPISHLPLPSTGVQVDCFQTNYEGELVERIHAAHVSGEYAAVRAALPSAIHAPTRCAAPVRGCHVATTM